MIVAGGCLALGSELLSLLHLFSFWPVLLLWTLVAFVSLRTLSRWMHVEKLSPLRLKELRLDERLVLILIAGLMVFALIVGLLSPPRSWDSMVYHLPRQVRWIQQGSLEFFPAHVPYQLFRGPLAETLQASLQLLTRTDLTVQLVSWAALLLALLYVGLLAGEIGASRRSRLLSSLIALCVPIAFLEASATKNDVVVAAWSLGFLWLLVRAWRTRRMSRTDALMIGLALGLAGLTKSSAYLLLVPVLPILAFLLARLRHRLVCGLLIAVAAIGVNIAHWSRNVATFGSPLGPVRLTRLFVNEAMSPARFISRFTREASLEIATPVASVNREVEATIRRLHGWLGVDVLDPSTSFPDRRFEVNFLPYNEYQAGAPLHFAGLVLLLVAGLILRHRLTPEWWLPALVPWAMFLWLCLVSKWEPYLNPRLHLLLFMVAAPAMGVLIESVSRLWTAGRTPKAASALVLLAAGLFVLQLYPSLSSSARLVFDPLPRPRAALLFSEGQHLRPIYEEAAAFVRSFHPTVVGIDSRGDWSWEYPLMRLVRRNLYEPAFVSVNPTLAAEQSYRAPDTLVVFRPVEIYTDHQSGRVYHAIGHCGFLTVLR